MAETSALGRLGKPRGGAMRARPAPFSGFANWGYKDTLPKSAGSPEAYQKAFVITLRIGDHGEISTFVFNRHYFSGSDCMNDGFSTPADTGSANNDNGYRRDACVYTERLLECGSIVSERNGKIIAKTSFLPTT